MSWGPRRRGLPQPGGPGAQAAARLRPPGLASPLPLGSRARRPRVTESSHPISGRRAVSPRARAGRGAPEGGGRWAAGGWGRALILFRFVRDYVLSRRLAENQRPSSCGAQERVPGAGCPRAGACRVLPRWTVAMATPARGCGKHALSKGALFPAGALQFQPAGAFQSWGGKGGQWGGRACE